MSGRFFAFAGGDAGPWRVVSTQTLVGEPLPTARRINIISADGASPILRSQLIAPWQLCGITSHDRYVVREEKQQLASTQQGLGRPEASCAALIPIRKNAAWWALTQDERRSILEEQSRHIKIGMQYLPAIARKLHHCRDLSENEPFDFLTWFEFAPEHESDFNKLVTELRASEEWKYVDREVDIRLSLDN